MIPVGYMAKKVSARPEWLEADRVVDVYSVSGCISKSFADYIPYWKHNGYWFFDSLEIIRDLARAHSLDLAGTSPFFYEVHERQFDAGGARWAPFDPEPFTTRVALPREKTLEGYDVVTFSMGSSPECSPLSCNSLATQLETNRHCLLASLDRARDLLAAGQFNNSEPGPYRVFAVYSVPWP